MNHENDWTDIFYDHNQKSQKESQKIMKTPKNSSSQLLSQSEESVYSYILSYFSCSCFTSSQVNYQQLT